MDRIAYLLTACALLLWSTLALAAAHLERFPNVIPVGIGLMIGGLLSAPRWREWEVSLPTRLVGVGGILCYHLLFFEAFRSSADDLTITVLNYLWPLLIVTLAPLILPKTPWSWRHTLAAVLGLTGTAAALGLDPRTWSADHLGSYGCAIGAALVWALYSLGTKRLKPFPSSAVGGFCLVSGGIALSIAGLRGELIPALSSMTWQEASVIIAMGIGPLGIAFFSWDAALKRGDPRVIGALSYATPLASVTWLICAGRGDLTWRFAVAFLLVCVGAGVGSWSTMRTQKPKA